MVPSPDPQSAAHRDQAPERIIEPACVVVPAGDFLMGCEQGRDEERPAHRVWVDAFEMAIYQVRNRDFAVFMQATGHPAPPNWGQAGFDDPDNPVVSVSWFEAQKYCQWLGGFDRPPLSPAYRGGMGTRRARRRRGPALSLGRRPAAITR